MTYRHGLDAWAVEWDHDWGRSLQWRPEPGPGEYRLFRTRAGCRAYIEDRYGYIRTRPDLRRPPFNWRMPRAVRVAVEKIAP